VTIYLDSNDIMAAAAAAIAPAEVLVRDVGLLESALSRPRASAFGEDAYPDVWLKAAALMESLARNRALVDGNKRLAWVATRLFLALNDQDIGAPSAVQGDEFVRAVAQGQRELREVAHALAGWVRPRS
jgi:death-on-curing protein